MAFDIDMYSRNAAAVNFEDLDFDVFGSRPLSDAGLRCLRYMSDVETHTICYLRDLLVTPSHTDPEVTTFLTMWVFEEYWHGEALARVLEAHGVKTGADHTRAVRTRLGWRDRWAPVQQALAANLIGEDFVAVHMTWGAINEWSTFAGYQRLVDKESHPVLTELLGRIMRQETRHVAFYVSQARARLERSPRARTLTRFALRKFWGPVGSGVMPDSEVAHLLTYLFASEEGIKLVTQLDEHVDQLPGLEGLNLLRRAFARFSVTNA
ncbi:MAG: ferritin-like domain-containing protein [Longispora sp.]|nr:ferritin-like domain-containing protein [Longispora sp. (in: high G+C Gram-positive bacteria)]